MSESSLYTCNNSLSFSCKAFLIFTANPPYNTVPTISSLTFSDQSEIAKLNNLKTVANFPTGQEIIVPVDCSCSSDNYYEATTTYTVLTESESYFSIANNTYQGLSTCDSLKHANSNRPLSFGSKLRVPLRCACPTSEQEEEGIKFLVTYSIGFGDTIYALSKQFNVSKKGISEANIFPTIIYPFTTVLIPMKNEPSSLHTLNRNINPITTSPLPSPIFRENNKSRIVLSIVGISAGAFSLLILLLFLILIFLFRKRETRNITEKNKARNYSPRELVLEIASFDRALKVFEFSELKRATRNFGAKNRIKGSSVYRGILRREILAVKKINGKADDEVKILQKINHFNIVKLRGIFCGEGKEYSSSSYLVYEYMRSGSLREWLSGRMLSWSQAIGIALDVANGLLYLHNFASPAYAHNNISSENILLDGNLRAKISNFNLATKIDGSIDKTVATKVDVFSFGVVLSEIITAGKYSVFEKGDRETILTTSVAATMESENVEAALSGFVGPGLVAGGGMEYALQVARLCFSCFRQDPAGRPEMAEVVSVLLKVQFSIEKPLLCSVVCSNVDLCMEDEITTSFSSSSFVF
ncbi:PREDICTED: protein LYK5-like [Erythranthe guttata]|nr:PREDICTED: protein LYK5-like [Erythranthe guttata]|eukprot:XP_012846273.1 PREDICTED: protein LYK5-like [Erythranthe guttata]